MGGSPDALFYLNNRSGEHPITSFALLGYPHCRKNGGHLSFHLRVSAKKVFIASHERRSALSLYALPFELSLPASGLVNL